MSSSLWLLPAIGALLGWGVSVFMPTLALKSMRPLHLMVWQALFFWVSVIVIQAFAGFDIEFNVRGALLAFGAGLFGALAQGAYMFALTKGPVTHAAMISSLYPLLVVALSYYFLDEQVTLRQGAGIALGVASIVLLVAAHED